MDQAKDRVVIAAIAADEDEFQILLQFISTIYGREGKTPPLTIAYFSSYAGVLESNHLIVERSGCGYNCLLVGPEAYRALSQEVRGSYEVVVIARRANAGLNDIQGSLIILDRDLAKLEEKLPLMLRKAA
jgi:methionine synthase I (cobalamin-dependent)